LRHQRAEGGDALRPEDAPAIGEREADERGAQVLRPRVERHQHPRRERPRYFLEELVLAREVVVDGLLGDLRTARDLVHARAVAVGEKGTRSGAQHALAVRKSHRKWALSEELDRAV